MHTIHLNAWKGCEETNIKVDPDIYMTFNIHLIKFSGCA